MKMTGKMLPWMMIGGVLSFDSSKSCSVAASLLYETHPRHPGVYFRSHRAFTGNRSFTVTVTVAAYLLKSFDVELGVTIT